ncbi:head-tail joining protein [Cereibacter azotoformans]|uniref:head-tail joining protein n=1 Tax=Cereibacter azotoformans TaxID=43057 RepID=UPI003B226F43
MPAPAWEDLSIFFDDFAVPAQLRRNGGHLRDLRVIFDEPSVDALLGTGRRDGASRQTRFETTTPMITAPESALAGAMRGDELIVNGRSFDVMSSPEVDGTGLATLRLAPQSHSGAR